jgi:hypothetical protein
MAPLATADALALFDTSLWTRSPVLVPMALDLAALRGGPVPTVLAELAATVLPDGAAPVDAARIGAELRQRLDRMPAAERHAAILALVRDHVAAVLGHVSGDQIDAATPFKEHGFDSLTGVELRNRLQAATGLRLPVTLVFDHPRPDAVARLLHAELCPDARDGGTGPNGGTGPEDPREAAIRDALLSIPVTRLREAGLLDPLLELVDGENAAAGTDRSEKIRSMPAEDLIRMALADTGDAR